MVIEQLGVFMIVRFAVTLRKVKAWPKRGPTGFVVIKFEIICRGQMYHIDVK